MAGARFINHAGEGISGRIISAPSPASKKKKQKRKPENAVRKANRSAAAKKKRTRLFNADPVEKQVERITYMLEKQWQFTGDICQWIWDDVVKRLSPMVGGKHIAEKLLQDRVGKNVFFSACHRD